jgi:hypothetical protein
MTAANSRSRSTRVLGLLAGFAVIIAGSAMAQPPAKASHADMPGMSGMPANGQHDMAAIVTAVDKKTGLLDVLSERYNLRLHFPPAALTGVEKGQRITLHMGFSKP